MIPDENTIICTQCGIFNITYGILINNNMYCLKCYCKKCIAEKNKLKMTIKT
jgi:hypothetical protein